MNIITAKMEQGSCSSPGVITSMFIPSMEQKPDSQLCALGWILSTDTIISR